MVMVDDDDAVAALGARAEATFSAGLTFLERTLATIEVTRPIRGRERSRRDRDVRAECTCVRRSPADATSGRRRALDIAHDSEKPLDRVDPVEGLDHAIAGSLGIFRHRDPDVLSGTRRRPLPCRASGTAGDVYFRR